MALAQVSNCLVFGNGDTFTGPIRIKGILVVPGSTATTATLSCDLKAGGSQVFFDAGTLTATSASIMYPHTFINTSQANVITAAVSGTGAKIYVYTE